MPCPASLSITPTLSPSLRAMCPISLIHLPIMSVTQSTTTMHGGDVQLRSLPNIEVEHCHSNLEMSKFSQGEDAKLFLRSFHKINLPNVLENQGAQPSWARFYPNSGQGRKNNACSFVVCGCSTPRSRLKLPTLMNWYCA